MASAITAAILLFCHGATAEAQEQQKEIPKLFLKETTFNQFAYPEGQIDEAYTQLITAQAKALFANAKTMLVESYITADKPRKVVYYYSNLCGQRFIQEGDRFTYVFSQINGKPATRIEIYPMKIARIHREFWPTRINLYLVHNPLSVAIPENLNRSVVELKKRTGSYLYPGNMREDIARLDMEEMGKEAEIYIIDTEDDFESVHLFFRRLYGAFRVRMAMDGDLFTRDFEIDVSHSLTPEDWDKDLFVMVEENPIIAERNGNTQIYRGHVFIKYIFWKKDPEELNKPRGSAQNEIEMTED
ncbi:MAG: hypothetical protein EHM72_07465 [Calditrichaeota bacterium]|nr:MAG: hypothetical protein EHM72_07465 [Calditrichota bacterium]